MEQRAESKKKTGLAEQIRAYASRRRDPFTMQELYAALQAPPGHARKLVRYTFKAFVKRGEIRRVGDTYIFNATWTPRERHAPVKQQAYKAMFISQRFTLRDIRRLIGADSRVYVQTLARRLIRAGHLAVAGYVRQEHGTRPVRVLRIVDRKRFRNEVME